MSAEHDRARQAYRDTAAASSAPAALEAAQRAERAADEAEAAGRPDAANAQAWAFAAKLQAGIVGKKFQTEIDNRPPVV